MIASTVLANAMQLILKLAKDSPTRYPILAHFQQKHPLLYEQGRTLADYSREHLDLAAGNRTDIVGGHILM